MFEGEPMATNISDAQLGIIGVIVLWDLIWKGLAMWRAAKRQQPVWFVLLLIINSAGILPICYILFTEQRPEVLEKT